MELRGFLRGHARQFTSFNRVTAEFQARPLELREPSLRDWDAMASYFSRRIKRRRRRKLDPTRSQAPWSCSHRDTAELRLEEAPHKAIPIDRECDPNQIRSLNQLPRTAPIAFRATVGHSH